MWGFQISWVGSFSRTKREVFSGTKVQLICILFVIFEFSATFWLFGTKYLNLSADILVFGAKISKSCLFKVNGGGGGGSGDLREASALVSGNNVSDTPRAQEHPEISQWRLQANTRVCWSVLNISWCRWCWSVMMMFKCGDDVQVWWWCWSVLMMLKCVEHILM